MILKDEVIQLAAQYANEGWLCSEAVLMALANYLDYKGEAVPRIATGFGAGIGQRGEVCGALSGGIMGLGLKFGRMKSDKENSRRPHWFAAELALRFEERFDNLRCRDLLGLDLSQSEENKIYHEKRMWETTCREIIKTVTGISYDLLS
jgi:C_GCAxxG_C_C family probable redox protein